MFSTANILRRLRPQPFGLVVSLCLISTATVQAELVRDLQLRAAYPVARDVAIEIANRSPKGAHFVAVGYQNQPEALILSNLFPGRSHTIPIPEKEEALTEKVSTAKIRAALPPAARLTNQPLVLFYAKSSEREETRLAREEQLRKIITEHYKDSGLTPDIRFVSHSDPLTDITYNAPAPFRSNREIPTTIRMATLRAHLTFDKANLLLEHPKINMVYGNKLIDDQHAGLKPFLAPLTNENGKVIDPKRNLRLNSTPREYFRRLDVEAESITSILRDILEKQPTMDEFHGEKLAVFLRVVLPEFLSSGRPYDELVLMARAVGLLSPETEIDTDLIRQLHSNLRKSAERTNNKSKLLEAFTHSLPLIERLPSGNPEKAMHDNRNSVVDRWDRDNRGLGGPRDGVLHYATRNSPKLNSRERAALIELLDIAYPPRDRIRLLGELFVSMPQDESEATKRRLLDSIESIFAQNPDLVKDYRKLKMWGDWFRASVPRTPKTVALKCNALLFEIAGQVTRR